MNIYLTSEKLDGVNDLAKTKEVVSITTAANVYDKKIYIDADREWFENNKYIITEFDLHTGTPRELSKILTHIDIIYVSGGNVFYLLQEIYAQDYQPIINNFIQKPDTLYIGSSAGACILGIDIAPLAEMDDPKEAPDLEETHALNIVESVIVPHFDNSKYKSKIAKVTDACQKAGHNILSINDDQAITIIDGVINYQQF